VDGASGDDANPNCASADPCKTLAEVVGRAQATAADNPDRIIVGAGTYTEDLRLTNANLAGLLITGAGTSATPGAGTIIRATTSSINCVSGQPCLLQLGSFPAANGIALENVRLEMPTDAPDTKFAVDVEGQGETLRNVVIDMQDSSNTTSAVYAHGTATLDHTNISGNWVGGGVNARASVLVEDSSIVAGLGVPSNAAVTIIGGSSGNPRTLTIQRSRLSYPSTSSGRVVSGSAEADILVDSSLLTGGAIGVEGSAGPGSTPGVVNVEVRNSTIDPGDAGGSSGLGVSMTSGTVSSAPASALVDSSIILADQSASGSFGTVLCNYSDVHSNQASGGVTCGSSSTGDTYIGESLFTNAAGGDYHLAAGSAAIDSGNPAALSGSESTTDLEGHGRVLDGNGDCTARRDRGALEVAQPAGTNCGGGNTGPTGTTGNAGTTPPGNQGTTTPSNLFSFGAFKNGKLTVVVPGPGTVVAQDAGAASATTARKRKKRKALVKTVRKTATKAGKVVLKIKPSKAGKKVLRHKHKLRVKLRVTFTPTGGKPASHTKTVTLKLAKRKR
jgi:serralysin